MVLRDVKVFIGVVAVTGVLLISATCSADTTTTLRIRSLQKEYTETAQQVRAGQEHLLRLEGAISILQQMNDDVATATQALKE